MKHSIFFILISIALFISSCETDNYYYYDPYSPNTSSENINIKGVIVGIDSLEALSNVQVNIFFSTSYNSFDSVYTDTNAYFNYLYNYSSSSDKEIRFVCKANDSIHVDLDTILEMSGRDLSSGLFNVHFILDTL